MKQHSITPVLVLLLILPLYAQAQDQQSLTVQVNSTEKRYTLEWVGDGPRTLLLWNVSAKEQRSAAVNMDGAVDDSLVKAMTGLGIKDDIRTLIRTTVAADLRTGENSVTVFHAVEGQAYHKHQFIMSKNEFFRKNADTTKPKDSTVYAVNGRFTSTHLDSALRNAQIADTLLRAMAKNLARDRRTVESELRKRITELEAKLNTDVAVGTLQLRSTMVQPSTDVKGYWSITGPSEKAQQGCHSTGCFLPIGHTVWSYLMPYFLQIDDLEEVQLTSDRKVDSLEIMTTKISIHDGLFDQIIVRTKDPRSGELVDFYSDAPISISTWDNVFEFNNLDKYENVLWGSDAEGNPLTILANDVFYYTINPQNGSNYIPSDTIISFSGGKNAGSITLMKQSFADYFDLRAYSDFAGLKKDNPNGILQLDLRYRFILNNSESNSFFEAYQHVVYPATIGAYLLSTPFRNSEDYIPVVAVLAGSVVFFNTETPVSFATKLEPFLTLAKVEEKQNLTIAASTPDSAVVQRFALNRYADMKYGLDLEYMRARFTKLNLFASIGVSAGIIRTPMDSLTFGAARVSGEQQLYSWFAMPYVLFEPINSEYVKFQTKYGLLVSRLMDRKIAGVDVTDVVSGSFIHVLQTDFNMYTDLRDKTSWIFLRAVYHVSYPNSDLSLQFGYSTSLSDVIKTGAK